MKHRGLIYEPFNALILLANREPLLKKCNKMC